MAIEDKALDQAFTSLNRKFEEEEAARAAAKWQLPYFDLTGFPVKQEDLSVVTKAWAKTAGAVPFFSEGREIRLGTSDPSSAALQELVWKLKKKNYEVKLYVVSQSALEETLKQYKKIISAPSEDSKEVSVRTDQSTLERFRQLEGAGVKLKTIPVTEILERVFGAAVLMRASDVHLEPEKKELKVRFRVDGVLQEMLSLHKEILPKLISRIKLLSKLKLNITSEPQDGRFSIRWEGRSIDIRVSVLPSAYGETVVMRLLGLEEKALDMDELGLQPSAKQIVMTELKKRVGMILTTGPTGSGKTTTLYSFLSHLNIPGVKIITLEDPVEYRLEGVTQTPIDRASGVDFASALKSVLRQDPDIIMVGEVRDAETADTAAQAALTGHMVLSTLHTNDAAGSIPRLLDMGVKAANLAPALNALIAQRLLRRICEECKEVYKPDSKELQRVKAVLEKIPEKAEVMKPKTLTFYHSKGCEACHNLGYKGRVGVFEAFAVNDQMERLVFQTASSLDIKVQAREDGMLTMQEDAVLKALQGITDLAEVWRVTGE